MHYKIILLGKNCCKRENNLNEKLFFYERERERERVCMYNFYKFKTFIIKISRNIAFI